MKLKLKPKKTEPAEPVRQCQRLVIEGRKRNQSIERQCKNAAMAGSNYCKFHTANNNRRTIKARYGIGNQQTYALTRLYKEKYAGRVWDCSEEVAFLRACFQRVTENLNMQDWREVLHHLPKLTSLAKEIAVIGEKHAKIEDALKLKLEFKVLQAFVNFMVGTIHKHVNDEKAKAAVARELTAYLDRLENPNLEGTD